MEYDRNKCCRYIIWRLCEIIREDAVKCNVKTREEYLQQSKGLHVGYFKYDSVDDLKALVAEAEAARDNKDTSKYTYGEWSMVIDRAVKDLKENDAAKVPLYAEDIYALGSVYHKSTSLEFSTAGLKAILPSSTSSKISGISSVRRIYRRILSFPFPSFCNVELQL